MENVYKERASFSPKQFTQLKLEYMCLVLNQVSLNLGRIFLGVCVKNICVGRLSLLLPKAVSIGSSYHCFIGPKSMLGYLIIDLQSNAQFGPQWLVR